MNNDSSTSAQITEEPVQAIGKNQVIVTKPSFRYVPDKEPTEAGRKSVFENERIMALLESAYKIGATHEEAALHAGMASMSPIKYHVTAKTVLRIMQGDKDTGERVTFPDLIELWKGNLTLAAKNAIYQSITAKNTQDSWRVLERKQRGEWGLQAGQGSVDGSGGMVAPLLGAESMDRMKEFAAPPAETKIDEKAKESLPVNAEPHIHPMNPQAIAESPAPAAPAEQAV
jgi:hypothetical protein